MTGQNFKSVFLCVCFLINVVYSIPAPQDPNDEVEFVRPTNTNSGINPSGINPTDFIPSFGGSGGDEEEVGAFPGGVIVIRRVSNPVSSGFPFFGGFGPSIKVAGESDESFPGDIFDSQEPEPGNSGFGFPGILKALLGGGLLPDRRQGGEDIPVYDEEIPVLEGELIPVEQPDVEEVEIPFGNANCGLICQIMKGFQGQIEQIETEIKEIKRKQQDKENEIEPSEDDDESGEPKTTYEEKVLPDGSVVKINRTVVHDLNPEDGTIFFHSTSFHNFEPSEEETEVVEELPTEEPVEGEIAIVEDEPKEYEEIDSSNNSGEDFGTPVKLVRERRSPIEEPSAWSQQVEAVVPFTQQQLQRQQVQFGGQVPQRLVQLPFPQYVGAAPFTGQQQQQPLRLLPTSGETEGNEVEDFKPVNYGDDTRVNDLLSQNYQRAGLIRIDPDSEIIRINEEGRVEPVH